MFESICWRLKWEKYSLEVKKSIVWQKKKEHGELVEKWKKEYDKEVKALQGKIHYNYKRKKHVPIKPKQGFLATAVREFYSDLADVKHDDNNLSKALNLQKDALIGDERVDFWKEFMSQNNVTTLKEVIRNPIPPKEVKRKANVEVSELLDCEGEEISLEELQQKCDEAEMTENGLTFVEDNTEVVDATTTVQSNNDQSNSSSILKYYVSFSNLTNDPDIKRDSEFLDNMQQIMTNGNTLKLFIPIWVV